MVQMHARIQARVVRPIWPSQQSRALRMQVVPCGPTYQPFRFGRLHSLIRAAKQHLGFCCIHSCNLNEHLLFRNTVPLAKFCLELGSLRIRPKVDSAGYKSE